jgi:hypothetical protein
MKTPMQESILFAQQLKKEVAKKELSPFTIAVSNNILDAVIDFNESQLEKEKEVINKAYEMGSRDYLANLKDDYYNETFNTKEK